MNVKRIALKELRARNPERVKLELEIEKLNLEIELLNLKARHEAIIAKVQMWLLLGLLLVGAWCLWR